jgi:hypothetical protein
MQNSVYFKIFINIKKMNISTNNIKQKSNMLIFLGIVFLQTTIDKSFKVISFYMSWFFSPK